jgi:hypothetical protein
MGAELFHKSWQAGLRTDGHNEANTYFFRNFVMTPKSGTNMYPNCRVIP